MLAALDAWRDGVPRKPGRVAHDRGEEQREGRAPPPRHRRREGAAARGGRDGRPRARSTRSATTTCGSSSRAAIPRSPSTTRSRSRSRWSAASRPRRSRARSCARRRRSRSGSCARSRRSRRRSSAYAIPEREELDARVAAVLGVVYAMFNEGHTGGPARLMRLDLQAEALRLGRLLCDLAAARAGGVRAVRAHGVLRRARRDARRRRAASRSCSPRRIDRDGTESSFATA